MSHEHRQHPERYYDDEGEAYEDEGMAIQRGRVPTPTERIAAVEREINELREAIASLGRALRTHWHPDSP